MRWGLLFRWLALVAVLDGAAVYAMGVAIGDPQVALEGKAIALIGAAGILTALPPLTRAEEGDG